MSHFQKIMHNRIKRIKAKLLKKYDNAKSELKFKNNFELIISVVLSAQCTDKRVNQITPKLFQKFDTAEKLSKANIDEVIELIRSCNFFQNKAKYLIGPAKKLVNEFNSEVPLNFKDLISLPGVGEKTANVVLIEALGKNVMAVDTHVFRVAHRLNLTSGKTPQKVGDDLTNLFKTDLNKLHQAMVLFGRYHCKAKDPQCLNCILKEECQF